MQLVIFGPPGVGKGTLASILSKRYNIPHISTGDIFRNEISSGNSELIQYVEKGLLVPDMVVNKLVEKAVWKLKKKVDIVLNMVASEDEIIKRMTARRNCSKCGALYNIITMKPKKKDVCDKCGSALSIRKDDEPETVKKRIKVYQEETSPLVDYYKKKKLLVDIDAAPKPKEVFNSIVKAIEKEIPK